MSHALWATWWHGGGTHLTVTGYRQAGRIAKAIVTTAEQAYADPDPNSQRTAHRMLLRLVRVREDSTDTAQAIERSLLVHGLPDPRMAQQVITVFTDARLLTLDRDTARISHEALLRAWPRLRGWIDNDREWLRRHQQLTDDAHVWEQSGRDPSLLYRETRLAALRQRAAESSTGATDPDPLHDAHLGAVQRAFVDASITQELKEHTREKRRRRRLRSLVVALTILLITSLTASAIAYVQNRRARAQFVLAVANGLHTDEPTLSTQLMILAARLSSPDATQTLSANLIDSTRHRVWTAIPDAEAATIAFTALPHDENPILASSGPQGTTVLWDYSSGLAKYTSTQIANQPTAPPGHRTLVNHISTASSGTAIASTAVNDPTVTLWRGPFLYLSHPAEYIYRPHPAVSVSIPGEPKGHDRTPRPEQRREHHRCREKSVPYPTALARPVDHPGRRHRRNTLHPYGITSATAIYREQ
ncbi:hypothetical protein K7711_32400 [Nocardia sp. CA2R105]|uniref:nSTAND1 domain-containing NTPase n=1 Tax=Nocardia coffeae TaxID=2873381 RepID=UPI001CA72E53|nr:hypothetical protein [Nocardia coffeae]MBY8861217.1 hypothetical protein [Nocardia coffeae]